MRTTLLLIVFAGLSSIQTVFAQASSPSGKFVYSRTEIYQNGELDEVMEPGMDDCPFYTTFKTGNVCVYSGFNGDFCDVPMESQCSYSISGKQLTMQIEYNTEVSEIVRVSEKELVVKQVKVKDTGFGKTTTETFVYWNKVN